jgi:hypothetical protein
MLDMTFEEAWKIVDKIGVWDALVEEGARALWDAAVGLGPGRHFVEIGCHLGRSSTLFMLLAKQHKHSLTFIDPWAGPPFGESDEKVSDVTAASWFWLIRGFHYPFTLHCCRTEQIPEANYPRGIDFIYIDGSHTERCVEIDCRMIEEVTPGGIVAFDNYGTHPPVQAAVDRLLSLGVLKKRALAGIVMVTEKA